MLGVASSVCRRIECSAWRTGALAAWSIWSNGGVVINGFSEGAGVSTCGEEAMVAC